MNMEKTVRVNYSSPVSLPVLVFIVFLTFKLAGIGTVATWSWWWVTSPLWISAALGMSIAAVVLGVSLIIAWRSQR